MQPVMTMFSVCQEPLRADTLIMKHFILCAYLQFDDLHARLGNKQSFSVPWLDFSCVFMREKMQKKSIIYTIFVV